VEDDVIKLSSLMVGAAVFTGTAGAFAQGSNEPTQPDGATVPAREKKFKLGLSAGYGTPFGAISPGDTLDQIGDHEIPIALDAGYMVSKHLLLGVYGQYGLIGGNCDPSSSCSVHDIHVGIEGQYHFEPGKPIDPWVGLGVGYESLSYSASSGADTRSLRFSGVELARVQVGVDFKLADAFTLGPVLSGSIDESSRLHFESKGNGFPPNAGDEDVQSARPHGWLTIGVKGSFGI